MTTPSPLSPVVGEAQASPKLTDVERAAMGTDLHVIACDTPLGQCVECMAVFRTVRRIVVAVTPAIAKDQAKAPGHECMYSQIYTNAEKALDELLGPDEEDGCGGGLVADIWHLARRCEHYEDDSVPPPVAAVSIPIPDGEE